MNSMNIDTKPADGKVYHRFCGIGGRS